MDRSTLPSSRTAAAFADSPPQPLSEAEATIATAVPTSALTSGRGAGKNFMLLRSPGPGGGGAVVDVTPRAPSTSSRSWAIWWCSGLREVRRSGTCHSRAIRPSSSTSTRSARAMASSTSWVTSRIAGWCRSQSCVTSACISMRVSASRALNGSSSSSRSGSLTSARASETRWAWPPDSEPGHTSAFSVRLTSASAPRTFSRRLPSRTVLSSASSTLRSTVRQGSRRGSWKATEVRPVTATSPLGEASRPARLRSRVDLPEPLRPSRATNSPRRTVRFAPRSTCVLPKERWWPRTSATVSPTERRVSGAVFGRVVRSAMPAPSSRSGGQGSRWRGRGCCRRRARRRSRRSAGTRGRG